ncbi:MAG: energy transducer TonB [Pseudopelagicola sp.]|nr:energy transducer TonB [Pseudopelagicola sp.]
MRLLLEVPAFLAIATLAHLVIWSPGDDMGDAGSGVGGEALLSIKPSSANLQQLVDTWETPPQATTEITTEIAAPLAQPDLLDRPDRPNLPKPPTPTQAPRVNTIDLPDMAQRPDAPPMPMLSTPPAPKPPPKPAPKPKPQAKKKPAPKQSPASAPVSAKRAKGTGGGVAQGRNQASKTATLSTSKKASLLSKWGGQIRARIARKTPRGGGRGTAVVKITVSGSGVLQRVSLAKSSGSARLDKIALNAVRNAGRFPAAPAGLAISSQTFHLPIKSR